MINLAGFCGADTHDCAMGSASADPLAAALNSPYAPQVQSVIAQVGATLYRIAANVGKTVLCPVLPAVGETIGFGLAAQLLPAELALGLPGFGIAISSETLAGIIGKETGTQVRKSLCGY